MILIKINKRYINKKFIIINFFQNNYIFKFNNNTKIFYETYIFFLDFKKIRSLIS
jgi:hypothetical protein